MTEPLTALCDHCDKITDVEFKKAKHLNGIEETYFECEHCYYHYTSFVTDKWVRKKQRALKGLPRKSGKTMINAMVLDEKQLEVNKRMNLLKYNLINYGRADL